LTYTNDMLYKDRLENFKSTLLGYLSVDQVICQKLTSDILALENKILSFGTARYPAVPANTITARHDYYNLIDLLPTQLTIIKHNIVEASSNIIGGEEFYVKMWANIFRNGERIERHMHHASPIIENDMFKKNVFKTICGNLFLYGDAPSDTLYYGKELISMPNKVGDIHLFSCILEHETLPFTGTLRVGIAFDVYSKNFFPEIGIQTPPNLRLIHKNSV
jgi:hypothetical protein